MKSRHLILITLSFIGLASAVKAETNEDIVVGTWYAYDYYSDHESRRWLIHRMKDHSYEALSITCTSRSLTWLEIERGSWQFENGVLINTPESYENFNGIKPAEADDIQTYTNVELDDGVLSYKNSDELLQRFRRNNGSARMECGLM